MSWRIARCFSRENGRHDLDLPQDGERQRDDRVVAASEYRPASVLKWTVTESASWSIAWTSAPKRMRSGICAVERVRQDVHAARRSPACPRRPCRSPRGTPRSTALLIPDSTKFMTPYISMAPSEKPLHLQELADAVAVVLAAGCCSQPAAASASTRRPELAASPSSHRSPPERPRSWSATSKPSSSGVEARLLGGHPLPADVDQALRVAHHERAAARARSGRCSRASGRGRAGCAWPRPRRTGPARTCGACRRGRRRGSGPRGSSGSWPARASSYAATRPAMPAPMMMTRLPGLVRRSKPCMSRVSLLASNRRLGWPVSGRRVGAGSRCGRCRRFDDELAVVALELLADERARDGLRLDGHADRALPGIRGEGRAARRRPWRSSVRTKRRVRGPGARWRRRRRAGGCLPVASRPASGDRRGVRGPATGRTGEGERAGRACR